MKKTLTYISTLLLLAYLPLHAQTDKKDNIHMFPEAKEGYIRYVIEVPKTQNDYNHKVELLIGKNTIADCNQRSLWGKIEEVSLKGWGYKYIEIRDIQSGPTTMMQCPEPPKEKFLTIRDDLRRYNSRLPIVVYVPTGYEVRYRIWNAEETIQEASKK